MSTVKSRRPGERWRPIVGYSLYQVSDYGRVKTRKAIGATSRKPRKNSKLLRPGLTGGYHRVGMTGDDGKRNHFLVHRLVAQAFICPVKEGMIVNHKDGNRINNHVNNLEVVGHATNALHRDVFEWVRLAVRAELSEFFAKRHC